MPAPARARNPISRSRDSQLASREGRFERRLGEILAHATEVFYDKGYEGASMRDLSRATGTSLAGLYYYFESKEKLLYLVQKHTFGTIMEQLAHRLKGITDPEERVRAFIRNHLEYFLANLKAMTVLSHEDQALKNDLGQEIRSLKREYYRFCQSLIEDLRRERGERFNPRLSSRVAVLSLFGMLNWIYTWHKPRVDAGAEELAQQMGDLFLHGVVYGGRGVGPSSRKSATRG